MTEREVNWPLSQLHSVCEPNLVRSRFCLLCLLSFTMPETLFHLLNHSFNIMHMEGGQMKSYSKGSYIHCTLRDSFKKPTKCTFIFRWLVIVPVLVLVLFFFTITDHITSVTHWWHALTDYLLCSMFWGFFSMAIFCDMGDAEHISKATIYRANRNYFGYYLVIIYYMPQPWTDIGNLSFFEDYPVWFAASMALTFLSLHLHKMKQCE